MKIRLLPILLIVAVIAFGAITILISRLVKSQRISQQPKYGKTEWVPIPPTFPTVNQPAGTKVAETGTVEIYKTQSMKNNQSVLNFTYLNRYSGKTIVLPDSFPANQYIQAYPEPSGKYVAISVSNSKRDDVSAKRSVTVYTVEPLQKVQNELCMAGVPRFWKNYLIFDTCTPDTGVASIYLFTDSYQVISKGTVKDVIGNNLIALFEGRETTVELPSLLTK